MKAVIQRVTRASVDVDDQTIGRISLGLLVLLGVAKGDEELDCRSMVDKLRTFRIFPDDRGKMNRSLVDVEGAVLLVSQFTLLADSRNGRRPSFDGAAEPDKARYLYEQVAAGLRSQGTMVETGVFAAHMRVELVNDGPVTFVFDTR